MYHKHRGEDDVCPPSKILPERRVFPTGRSPTLSTAGATSAWRRYNWCGRLRRSWATRSTARHKASGRVRTAALRCFCRALRTAAGRPCMRYSRTSLSGTATQFSYIPPALWRPPRKNCWLPLWRAGQRGHQPFVSVGCRSVLSGRGPGASNCTPFSGKPCTRKCYVCRVRSRANGNRHRLASAAERTAADWYFYRARRISGYRAVSKWIPDGLRG